MNHASSTTDTPQIAEDDHAAPQRGHGHGHGMTPDRRPARTGSGFLPYLVGLIAVAVLLALFLLGYLPKVKHAEALRLATEGSYKALIRVRVATPQPIPPEERLALPGAVAATRDTMIFARATGYVHAWHFDLGDPVKAGDLLAEIDQPEVDQELLQARATLDQSRLGVELAKGNAGLSTIKLQRQKSLGPNLTPQQDIDNAQSNFDIATVNLVVAGAKVKADEANVHRLEELVSFGHVIAPFDGVITQRYIEVGNLVNAGSGAGGQPLYHLMQINPILVLVDVPQISAASIALGQKASVRPNGSAVAPIPGAIAHIANAIDPVTRTMRVQILADNAKGALLPGMYGQAEIQVPAGKPLLSISSGSLLLSGDGTRVAVVTGDSRIAFKTVEIERDNGATLVIASGLSVTDRVVTNPAGHIEDGMPVEVAEAPAPEAPAAGKPASPTPGAHAK
jgi:RND family efflux transporter MFP subunit